MEVLCFDAQHLTLKIPLPLDREEGKGEKEKEKKRKKKEETDLNPHCLPAGFPLNSILLPCRFWFCVGTSNKPNPVCMC